MSEFINLPIVFFNGWGMDNHAISSLVRPADFHSLYRYPINPEIIATLPSPCVLIAWSMGVWAAHQARIQRPDWQINYAIAINGTPYGIDAKFGIPPTHFAQTAEYLAQANHQTAARDKLYRRMFTQPQARHHPYHAYLPKRSLSDQLQELRYLLNTCPHTPTPPLTWHTALISTDDTITPSANQYRYWQTTPTRIVKLNAPHHPFAQFNSWSEMLAL